MSDDAESLFGDFCWWTRSHVFTQPACGELVPDVPLAVAQLRRLYDADACRRMFEKGDGSFIAPLFLEGGFVRHVNQLLQLGRDLAEFPAWQEHKKLVGELRTTTGWDGARFEVGVQAGLRRAGLEPVIEPGRARSEVRPDFVVQCGASSVALELKTSADPDYIRNRQRLNDRLAHFLYPRLGTAWRGDVTLVLSRVGQDELRVRPSEFTKTLRKVEQSLAAVAGEIAMNARVPLGDVGHLEVAYPRWGDPVGFAGSYVVVPAEIDAAHLVGRVLVLVRESARQLAAVDADLRIAVVWVSHDLLPAEDAARVVQEEIEDDPTRWDDVAVDWIVLLNAHAKSMQLWTIDLGVCRMPGARSEIPPEIRRGLAAWGGGRR